MRALLATDSAALCVCCRSRSARARARSSTWSEACQLLAYGTGPVQRQLGLRVRPGCVDEVPLTRTQMARLAQGEGPAHPHILRSQSPRASSTTILTTPSHAPPGASPRRARPAGVPAQ